MKMKGDFNMFEMPTITLLGKYRDAKINDNEVLRKNFLYSIDDKTAYMMAVIEVVEGKECVRVYNMDSNHYYDEKNEWGDEIPKNILKELENIASNQIQEDYKKIRRIIFK